MSRLVSIVILMLFTVLSCTQKPDRPQHRTDNSDPAGLVMLITIDTWRYDAWSALGDTKVETPNLDALAKEGVIFTNAFAHAVVTLPSHASILTGQYPHRHGLRDNAGYRLGEDVRTLSHAFRDAGYATGAFVSAFPLDARYGLNHGFDHYDDAIASNSGGQIKMPERAGVDTIKAMDAWLDEQGDRKTFVWLHLYEPHYPYVPPEPFRSRYADQPYYGEVAYTDALLSPIFQRLRERDARDGAIAVVTNDHGEALGEHGELTHGVFAYNSTLKTPLFFWAPDRLAPGIVEDIARHVDLAPSMLALNGMAQDLDIDGQDLFGPDYAPEPSYFESLTTFLNRGWAPLRGCVDDGRKAIQLPTEELYDLAADPRELDNLALTDPERAALFMGCLPFEPGLGEGRGSLSAEELEKLQALGYVAGAETDTERDISELPDPKDLMDMDRRFHEALAAHQQGRVQEAVAVLEELTQNQPQMAVAYFHLSDIYESANQLGRAVDTLKRAVASGVRTEQTFRKLALFLTASGEAGEALELMTPFLDSQDPESHVTLGKIHTAAGRPQQASISFQAALRLDPNNPKALGDLGTLALMTRNLEEAETFFSQALNQDTANADAWNGIGVVYAQTGREDQAIQAWETAIVHNPNLAFCHYNLGLFYERRGRVSDAIERFRAYAALTTGEQRARALQKIEALTQE